MSRLLIALGCAAAAAATLLPPCQAEIKVWVGQTGLWTTNTNWSPFGRPVNGDDAFLVSGDALNRTVTYNDTGLILHIYRSVRVDSSGSGLMTLQQTDPNTDLNAEFLYVGNAARGTYDLFAGRGVFGQTEVHAQGVLSVRSGAQVISGSLLQTGGTVSSPAAGLSVTNTYTFNAGSASGHITAGTFLSNGGTFGGGVTALHRLVLGGNGNGTFGGSVVNHGPLTIPAGRTLSVAGDFGQVGSSFTQVGNVSVGTESFLHSGATWTQQSGSHTARNLSIASDGNATYAIGPGAQLTTTGLDIALGGDGSFTQTGGVVSIGGSFIRGPILFAPGRMRWSMSDGTMNHSGAFVVGTRDAISGTYTQSGGFARVRSLHVNVDATTSASVNLSGGTFIADMNSVNHGAFNQTGGAALFAEHLDGAGDVSVTGTGSLGVRRMRQLALFVGGDGVVSLDPAVLGPFPPPAVTHRLRSIAFEQAGNLIKGTVDLGHNRLVIDYSGASPVALVRQYLVSGYAAGAWTGTGINSGAAALGGTAIGYAEASDVLGPSGGTFGGLGVDATALLLRHTLYGDANLDGTVNLQDFNRLAGNFGSTAAHWSQGDFNYDGVINLQDFNRLASTFGLSASPDGPTPEDWGHLAAAVPEPAAIGLCGLALLAPMMVGRNRRRADT